MANHLSRKAASNQKTLPSKKTAKELGVDSISVGDLVRSLDFPGKSENYVEGVVTGIEEHESCPIYVIKVQKDVWGGESMTGTTSRVGREMCPPVNGTPTSLGRITNGVTKQRPCWCGLPCQTNGAPTCDAIRCWKDYDTNGGTIL